MELVLGWSVLISISHKWWIEVWVSLSTLHCLSKTILCFASIWRCTFSTLYFLHNFFFRLDFDTDGSIYFWSIFEISLREVKVALIFVFIISSSQGRIVHSLLLQRTTVQWMVVSRLIDKDLLTLGFLVYHLFVWPRVDHTLAVLDRCQVSVRLSDHSLWVVRDNTHVVLTLLQQPFALHLILSCLSAHHINDIYHLNPLGLILRNVRYSLFVPHLRASLLVSFAEFFVKNVCFSARCEIAYLADNYCIPLAFIPIYISVVYWGANVALDVTLVFCTR